MVVTKVLLDGDIEPGIGRNEQQGMEVKASIAEDEWGGCGIPLVDLQVGSPDEDWKLVGRGGPRLAVRPGLIVRSLRAFWTNICGVGVDKSGEVR